MIKKNVIHIRNLKQALNHVLVLKKVHRISRFNKKTWLQSYIDMNTELRKMQEMILKKIFKLMNNAVFGKTMENMSKHRDIKVVTTETSRNYLLSEPNYHTTNFFQKIY